MWFKAIVTVTCVAVLFSIGYYFWDRYQTDQKRITEARFAALRVECFDRLETYVKARYAGKETTDQYNSVMECAGIVTPEEIEATGQRLLPH